MKLQKNTILVIASHNLGKVAEIRELFKEFPLMIKDANEFDLKEPEETGTTFAENALIKARAVVAATGHTAISDDSGLVVFALQGEPGIFSARWALDAKDFNFGIAQIEKKLKEAGTTDFTAKFVCALALCAPNGEEEIVEGEVFGRLVFPARGTKGFGYDPIFIADGMMQTYGEIESKLKDRINHRAVAFDKLKKLFSVNESS
ncbi:MAG: RdgB/HAM1 family non-canonical purine NTP pyrophosphatase [Gammaproteobacteria bacterium]